MIFKLYRTLLRALGSKNRNEGNLGSGRSTRGEYNDGLLNGKNGINCFIGYEKIID